jgi:hypothetical protein
MSTPTPLPCPTLRSPLRRIGLLVCLCSLLLYTRSLLFPVLLQDDFQILAASWTWHRTLDHLWSPQNEHVMPLGRLLTFALVGLARRPTAVPAVVAWVGPVALLAALGLVQLFVRRETGRSSWGWLAAGLFGVSAVYQQAVTWFAAAFSVWALVMVLLALLACQSWRQTGRACYLDLAILACALAPAWFASGILAGPLCCLYLLASRSSPERAIGKGWIPPSITLSPLLGTGLFLALSLPRAAGTILHLEHYQGKSAVEAFNPWKGVLYSARSLIDNLLLGVVGITHVEVPWPIQVVLLVILGGAAFWWWRRSSQPGLQWLGLGLIFGSYVLTYSARADWGYEGVMTRTAWSRYHLLPHLGLVLFVMGGLPRDWFPVQPDPRWLRRASWVLGALFVVQLPRAVLGTPASDPEQTALLRRIEGMDERCREHHISAEQARQVLPPLDLGRWASQVNGWEFLTGSSSPRVWTDDEVRRLLHEPPA